MKLLDVVQAPHLNHFQQQIYYKFWTNSTPQTHIFKNFWLVAIKGTHTLSIKGTHTLSIKGTHTLSIKGTHTLPIKGTRTLSIKGTHTLSRTDAPKILLQQPNSMTVIKLPCPPDHSLLLTMLPAVKCPSFPCHIN